VIRRLTLLALVLAFGAAACTSDPGDEAAESDAVGPSILEVPPTPTATDDGAEMPITELPDEEEGVLVNRFDLDPGDCFNTYPAALTDEEAQPTTRVVECERPHESEVYYQRNYPAGPDEFYPGAAAMQRWSQERCYREFHEFTGSEYEWSDLDIGVIHPTLTTWTGPGLHREVTCYVFAFTGGGLQGSMNNSGI